MLFPTPAIKPLETITEIWIASSIHEIIQALCSKEDLMCFHFENLTGRYISACPLDSAKFRGWVWLQLLHPVNSPLETQLQSGLEIENLDSVWDHLCVWLFNLIVSKSYTLCIVLNWKYWKGLFDWAFQDEKIIKSNESQVSCCLVWQTLVPKVEHSDLWTLLTANCSH